jgi:prepilin-type N-terminal cleavage/methylation domain-containing protein
VLNGRRGFTLVELLVSMVLVAIIGLATLRMLTAVLNTTTAQVEIAAAATSARTASVAVPQELREVGYDTIPMAARAVADLEVIADHRITFRAMRGTGITCGTPSLGELRIRRAVLGLRPPLSTDGFLLFVESDPNYALDDQWVPLVVSAIDYQSTCGADSAIAFTLATSPVVDPASGTLMAISQLFVGGPLRWYERMEYGPALHPRTGQAYVGARSLSLGERELTPLIGPLPDTTAFQFTYFGPGGARLNPATTNPIRVRAIGLDLATVTRPASLAGTTKRATYRVPVATQVALRNTLRP